MESKLTFSIAFNNILQRIKILPTNFKKLLALQLCEVVRQTLARELFNVFDEELALSLHLHVRVFHELRNEGDTLRQQEQPALAQSEGVRE